MSFFVNFITVTFAELMPIPSQETALKSDPKKARAKPAKCSSWLLTSPEALDFIKAADDRSKTKEEAIKKKERIKKEALKEARKKERATMPKQKQARQTKRDT